MGDSSLALRMPLPLWPARRCSVPQALVAGTSESANRDAAIRNRHIVRTRALDQCVNAEQIAPCAYDSRSILGSDAAVTGSKLTMAHRSSLRAISTRVSSGRSPKPSCRPTHFSSGKSRVAVASMRMFGRNLLASRSRPPQSSSSEESQWLARRRPLRHKHRATVGPAAMDGPHPLPACPAAGNPRREKSLHQE